MYGGYEDYDYDDGMYDHDPKSQCEENKDETTDLYKKIITQQGSIYKCIREDVYSSELFESIDGISKEYSIPFGKALWLFEKSNFLQRNVQKTFNDFSEFIFNLND